MKTITIKQPFASLIIEGIKDVENRTWKCPKKYIGQRVLIHASTNKTAEDPHLFLNYGQVRDIVNHNKELEIFGTSLTRGAIIGSVEIIDCVVNHSSIWAEHTDVLDLDSNVIYNWVLANPTKFDEPILAKGKLSFWNFPCFLDIKEAGQ